MDIPLLIMIAVGLIALGVVALVVRDINTQRKMRECLDRLQKKKNESEMIEACKMAQAAMNKPKPEQDSSLNSHDQT